MPKWVYSFGAGSTEGCAAMRDLLGRKGANLAEMAMLGLPVPPGFTLTTAVCAAVNRDGRFPDGLENEIDQGLARIEAASGLGFGDATRPLLLAVRSGARGVDAGDDGHRARSRPERPDGRGSRGRIGRHAVCLG